MEIGRTKGGPSWIKRETAFGVTIIMGTGCNHTRKEFNELKEREDVRRGGKTSNIKDKDPNL